MGNSLLIHLHLDIPSHLLGYSKNGQNRSAGIELKTCFLPYFKIKTYKITIYYFTNMIMLLLFSIPTYISITYESWNSEKVRRLTWGLLQWDVSSLGLEFQVKAGSTVNFSKHHSDFGGLEIQKDMKLNLFSYALLHMNSI